MKTLQLRLSKRIIRSTNLRRGLFFSPSGGPARGLRLVQQTSNGCLISPSSVGGALMCCSITREIAEVRPLFELTEDEWDRMLAVNLRAVFFVLQACAKRMR